MSAPSWVGQRRGDAGVVRAGLDDLAGVAVVGGDDDERVGVLTLVAQSHLHRRVELDGLADLAARVGRVVLLVDDAPSIWRKKPFC